MIRHSCPIFLIAAFSLLCCLRPSTLTAAPLLCPESTEKGDRALIIGVGAYSAGDSLRLKGPASDREVMHALLTEDLGYRPAEVCVLADDQATAEGIELAFKSWLIDGTKKGSRAFFYFSGHGVRLEGGGSDRYDERIDAALAAFDYQAASAAIPAKGVVRDDELGRLFDQLDGRLTNAVIDSCHSGTIYRSAIPMRPINLARTPTLGTDRGPPKTLTRSAGTNPLISPRAGLIVWTASADFEVAFDAPVDDPRYGQFTHAWADAVKTKPNASIASVRLQLLDAAKQFCRDLALKHHACTSLTPGIFAIEAIWQLPISGVLGTREPWESLSGRNIEFVIEELQNDSGRSAEVSIALRDMYGQDRTDFTSGEPMKLKIQTDLEGHLTLFALAGDNQLIRIFPLNSEDQERDWVEPRLQNVFENFQAKGSPANYKLVALVTKERLDQNERITRGGADWGDTPPKRPGSQALPVLPAPPASAAVADLLTQIINREGSGGGDFGRWGFAVAKLKIVEQLGR